MDEGECEAIALAIEIDAELLLIDERRGRAEADKLGLRIIGLLGVLVEAKQKGFIVAVKPVMDDLSYILPKTFLNRRKNNYVFTTNDQLPRNITGCCWQN